MNNSNELKLMEAQISKIFGIIETAENREISKIAAETLANKCLDNPFAIFIIFQNFLDFSKKGKLKVFDDAGFLIDLILEEIDKNSIKKLFEDDFFKEFALKISEENKFFYTFDCQKNEFISMESVEILSLKILDKFNFDNVEPLYSNKAEESNTEMNISMENKEMSLSSSVLGKTNIDFMFPIKNEINSEFEFEDCLEKNNFNNKNNDMNNYSTEKNRKKNNLSNGLSNQENKSNNKNNSIDNENKQNTKERISIMEFIDFFSEKINLIELKEKYKKFTEKYQENINNSLLRKKSDRGNNIIQENICNKNEKEEEDEDEKYSQKEVNKNEIENTSVKNSKKIRKISNETTQTTEKIEFYFNPLFSIIQNFLKLNSSKFWKTRLCSISALSLLNKYFDLFYYKFYKISFDLIKNKNKEAKKDEESEIISIENFKIKEFENDNKENKDYFEDKFISLFKYFEIKVKENLFTNLLIISLIDKVVDFDSEDYICIFKELNLKLANKILDSINNITSPRISNNFYSKDEKENIIKKINKFYNSIFYLLDQAINLNKINKDWQPIFSILTFLKIKIIKDPYNNDSEKNNNNLKENNTNDDNSNNNIIQEDIDNEKNLFFLNDNFLNVNDSDVEMIINDNNINRNPNSLIFIFQLIQKLMEIDSEEIVNITIQILNKIMEIINSKIIKYKKEKNDNENNLNTNLSIFIERNKIIHVFKRFILLINNYDDIEIGVKYYFNCLHSFIIFFKNLNEKISTLMDPVCKDIIENHLIFYSLNKNKSVRIKYFNLISNILNGNLIEFSNKKDFIQKNTLLCFQGIALENDKEANECQYLFIMNLLNSKEEDCINVFFEFTNFIIKLMLKKNIKDTSDFYIPENEKFDINEMESFYSTFFLNDMQLDSIKKNFDRKIKYILAILGNVMKNKIIFVKNIIKYLNLDLSINQIKISNSLLYFIKIYYQYLENIEYEENKTLIIPDELLIFLMDNKNLESLPIEVCKKDSIFLINGLKKFLEFLNNYKANILVNFRKKINNNSDKDNSNIEKFLQNFMKEDYEELLLIFTKLKNQRYINPPELDELLKKIFNKIKNYENEINNNNKNSNVNSSSNEVDMIYENFRLITNYIKKLEDSMHLTKISIRAYCSVTLFLHLIYTNKKIEKISNFVNPILICLKRISTETKNFIKNLISMIFNFTNSLESRNKVLNLFIDNSLNIYIEEINNYPNVCDSNTPNEMKVSIALKYFFEFFAEFNNNNEIKLIYENFFREKSLSFNSNFLSKNNSLNSFKSLELAKDNFSEDQDEYTRANNLLKKNIYFLYNICLIKYPTNFLDFYCFNNLLEEIFHNEFLLNLENLEKFLSMIIMNLNKIISKKYNDINGNENEEFDNSLIIDKIFSYLNPENNNISKTDILNPGINQENLNNNRTIIIILKILNIISDNQNFQLLCINYIFDVIKFINSKNEEIRGLATNLFSKLMKIISYIKLDKNYETQINSMKKNLKNLDNLNLIKNFVQQKDVKNLELESNLNSNYDNNKFSLEIKIKENLRYYQIAGIKWLSTLTSLGLGLALCDDMGLGKTIQTLCCIANESKIYIEKKKKYPISLIICPNTLILNWIKESNKFFDEREFKLKKFEGKNLKNLSFNNRKNILGNNLNKIEEEKERPIEIYVTSYDKIRELENFEQEFFYVILDEAHIIKNPKTKLYQNIKKINSERRIILTGTPIQNNVMELWSLFDFLMPGFLGSENDFEIKFHKKIYTNIKKLNLEEKLQENIFQSSLNDIRKRIKPFILRRLKQDVLKELPEKIIQDYICEMTDIQKDLYDYWENIYAKMGTNNNKKNLENNKEKEKNNKKNSNNDNNGKQTVLNVIDSMRKICNFPGMLLNKENFYDEKYKKLIDKNRNKIKEFNSSGKLKALEDILISFNFCSNNINNNTNEKNIIESNNNLIANNSCGKLKFEKIMENKILIFSQYRAMIQIIKEFIENNFKFIKIKTLTSDMNENIRHEVVNSFNNDPEINVLLLTTSIGGLGLSLTSANIVIMYDHDWNPMRDLQAMDRAHRLGQKKTVEVFRLITADSIEEKLISLQVFKKYIANNIVDQSKVHDNNLNMNSFMESLEEFSMNRVNQNSEKEKNLDDNNNENRRRNRKGIIDSFEANSEKEKINDDLEYEYLKRFI